ncbi:MAG: MFS transporter [Bdellovibrio sp.]|nr:MFS transporter [Bdellovibrio sp.]
MKKIFPILAVAVFIGLILGIKTALVSFILEKKGISTFLIGLQSSLGYLAITVASWPVEVLIRQRGLKFVSMISMSIVALSVLGYTLPFNYILWTILSITLGIGLSGIFIANESFILLYSAQESSAKSFAFYSIAIYAGLIPGSLIAIHLFSIADWLPFLVCGVVCLCMPGLLLTVKNETFNERKESFFNKRLLVALILPLSGAFTFGFLQGGLTSLLPVYILKSNFGDEIVGQALAIFLTGSILLNLPIAIIADKTNRAKFIAAIYFLSAILLGLSYFSRANLMLLGINALVIGGTTSGFYTISLSLLKERTTSDIFPTANSLFSIFFGVGTITGPLVMSSCMRLLSLEYIFLIPMLICLLAFFIAVFTPGRRYG